MRDYGGRERKRNAGDVRGTTREDKEASSAGCLVEELAQGQLDLPQASIEVWLCYTEVTEQGYVTCVLVEITDSMGEERLALTLKPAAKFILDVCLGI